MEKGSQSTKDKAARNLMILDIGYTWICPASHHRITCPPTVTARYHHLGPASVPTVNRFTCQAPCYKYTVLMNQKISVLLVGGGAYSIIEQVRFISWPAVIMSIEPSCLSHSTFRFVSFHRLFSVCFQYKFHFLRVLIWMSVPQCDWLERYQLQNVFMRTLTLNPSHSFTHQNTSTVKIFSYSLTK